jgi:hypothetical protein
MWELAKATAAMTSTAVSTGPSKSSNTVRNFSGSLASVCIRFNPDSPVPDIVPALQTELRKHGVQSKVYETTMPVESCSVWLKYATQIDWDTPPFSDQYKPFIRQASLSLRSAGGQLLSTSQYELDEGFAQGKWSTTRDKISPVVTSLLTGTEAGIDPSSGTNVASASTTASAPSKH